MVYSFESKRINTTVNITMTFEYVYYIYTQKNIDIVYKIKRDPTFHFNEDGLYRCAEYFEDPRFVYWNKTNSIIN